MKLATYQTKLTQNKDVAGMFSCTFEHEIKNTMAKASYTGPLMPENVWQEILAYFEWTQKEYKSEAQVRLFINPQLATWAAWAFPQRGNTGMASVELADTSPERTAQRAQFSDTDGWMPFGTVHHHCGGGAFQSGTDKDNEVHQDGIHITVGKIGMKQYDIHSRFYCARNGFEPDLSEFYDISDLVGQIPKWSHGFMRAGANHDLAVWKMTRPPAKEQTFPEMWKANYIIPPKVDAITHMFSGSHVGGIGQGCYAYDKRARFNEKWDLDKATRFLFDLIKKDPTLRWDDLIQGIDEIWIAPESEKLIEMFQECQVTPRPLLDHLESVMRSMSEQEAAEELKASGNGKKNRKHKDAPLLTDGVTVNEQGDMDDRLWQGM